ncbi:MAG: MarR family winged helix-turn-helix transcriptional regulator [Pseudobdellovibrio sp.]
MKIKKYTNSSPIFAINTCYEGLISVVNQSLKQEEVNFLQGLILTALFFENSENVTPSTLAETLQTTRGNISHMISYLEAKNLVKRSVNPSDARQLIITLKPDGRKKAIRLIKYYDKIQEKFEKQLGIHNCKILTEQILSLRYPL